MGENERKVQKYNKKRERARARVMEKLILKK